MGNLPDNVSLRAIDARSYGDMSPESDERLENLFAWRKALESARRGVQAELIALRAAADRIGAIDGVEMEEPVEWLANLAEELQGEEVDANLEISNIEQWDEDHKPDVQAGLADWARAQRAEIGA